MSGENPKNYNNPKDWEKIEKSGESIIVDTEKNIENTFFDDEDETIEITDSEDIFADEDENKKENFDDVLQLTAYDSGALAERSDFVIAEYKDIDVVEIERKHQKEAKTFVEKITRFVLEFNDVVLNEEHKKYLVQVGKFQLQHLSDLLYMTSVNKMMLNNIIARVNATQAEDYSIINSYNVLANQHLKLIKELQNSYKSIPSIMKKMRADVMTNQELGEGENHEDEVMTSEFGETQFNNSKQLLKSILEKKEKKNTE